MRRKPGALVPLETSILIAASHLLAREHTEFHGYEIARHLAEDAERKHLTAYGTLYRALARLQQMGLVESRWEDPQIAADENRPGRRLYSLTNDGMAAAEAAAKPEAVHKVKRLRPKVADA
jgi:DNA-binding PadR family transcriptional regulator